MHSPTTEERNTDLAQKVAAYQALDELIGLVPASVLDALRAQKLIPRELLIDGTPDQTQPIS